MRIAVMTDSTAYIPAETRKELGIHMVPLSVVFGDTSYQEEIDITTEAFYQKVREAEELPKTSQPSIGYITEKLTRLAADYDAVISIHLSSGISGTCQAVASAGEMVEGISVYTYDSELSCMAQGFYVFEAVKMAKENKTPEEIMARLDEMKQSMRAYFMVDDLKNLQRGGRLNSAQAIVGSLLQVKPILHFVDKVIVPFEKIRTRKKALNRIVGMLEDDISKGKALKVVIIHANCEEAARELQQEITEDHPGLDIMISYFGPVIGTHLGEGAIGIAWYAK
ncbi:DegV family EDD domain-containing protein [Virgibacillus dakarensis]|uniref:DegV family protein n=1 Tax=Virgibacillus dakarensis TaxID=1917889 RepID=UPI000B44EF37|nr:DegV family protein [Virgibacillus dakarensis]MBT2216093.1 DegV family protein [Virgibacillus dakarensis]MTW86391.1 DegV family EDD domain-containing protein [Virgibacillus dakarensis]